MDNTTGKRVPSRMYDFNWARLYAENTEMIGIVAKNIEKAGAREVEAAAAHAAVMRDACAELGLEVWRNNAQMLLDAL